MVLLSECAGVLRLCGRYADKTPPLRQNSTQKREHEPSACPRVVPCMRRVTTGRNGDDGRSLFCRFLAAAPTHRYAFCLTRSRRVRFLSDSIFKQRAWRCVPAQKARGELLGCPSKSAREACLVRALTKRGGWSAARRNIVVVARSFAACEGGKTSERIALRRSIDAACGRLERGREPQRANPRRSKSCGEHPLRRLMASGPYFRVRMGEQLDP